MSQDLSGESIDILLVHGHAEQEAVPIRSHRDFLYLSRQTLFVHQPVVDG